MCNGLVLHDGTAAACSLPGSALCAGGPDLEPDDEAVGWAKHAFAEYGPPMINALATLMLSFYANVHGIVHRLLFGQAAGGERALT